MNYAAKPETAPTVTAHTLADTLTAIIQRPQRMPPDPPLATPPPKINPYDALSVVVVVLAFATFVFLPLAVIAVVAIALKS